MKSKLAMAAATIALSGLIPGSSRGAETSDSTNVNEPFLKQMQQLHAFETKGLAAVIHEEQSAASETQQAAELLAQREMTAQGQVYGNHARQKFMAPPMGNAKNGRRAA